MLQPIFLRHYITTSGNQQDYRIMDCHLSIVMYGRKVLICKQKFINQQKFHKPHSTFYNNALIYQAKDSADKRYRITDS